VALVQVSVAITPLQSWPVGPAGIGGVFGFSGRLRLDRIWSDDRKRFRGRCLEEPRKKGHPTQKAGDRANRRNSALSASSRPQRSVPGRGPRRTCSAGAGGDFLSTTLPTPPIRYMTNAVARRRSTPYWSTISPRGCLLFERGRELPTRPARWCIGGIHEHIERTGIHFGLHLCASSRLFSSSRTASLRTIRDYNAGASPTRRARLKVCRPVDVHTPPQRTGRVLCARGEKTRAASRHGFLAVYFGSERRVGRVRWRRKSPPMVITRPANPRRARVPIDDSHPRRRIREEPDLSPFVSVSCD